MTTTKTATKTTTDPASTGISAAVRDVLRTISAPLPEQYTFKAMGEARPSLVELLKTTSKAYNPRRGDLRKLSDIQRVKVSYFWEPYIPAGALCAINGDAGSGKTWLSSKLNEAATRGGNMPHGATGKMQPLRSSPTILLQREASLGMTILPRSEELGADVDRITVPIDIAGFTFGHQQTQEDLDGFLRLAWYIESVTLEDTKPGFVFIDPIKSFLVADSNKDREVRPTLERLAALADFYQVPIIYVLHYNKNEGGKMAYRGSGSQEFANVPRSIIHTAKAQVDHEDQLRADLLLFHGKPLVYEGRNLAYSITGKQDDASDPLTWAWTEADLKADADSLSALEAEERKVQARTSASKPDLIRQTIIKILIAAGTGDGSKGVTAEALKMRVAEVMGDDFSDSSYRRAYQKNALGVQPYETSSGTWVWPALQPLDPDGSPLSPDDGGF